MEAKINSLRKDATGETYLNVNQFALSQKKEENQIVNVLETGDVNNCKNVALKLIIIDQLHLFHEARKLLLHWDVCVVRRLTKFQWFFEGTPNIFFITEIFPVVSLSTRLKVITALAKYAPAEQILSLYDYVLANFGLHSAWPLLCRLPENKLLSRLKQVQHFTVRNFIYVVKRYPKVAVELMNHLGDHDLYKHPLVKRQILFNDFETYCDIYRTKKGDDWSNILGRKASRSLVLDRLATDPDLGGLVRDKKLVFRKTPAEMLAKVYSSNLLEKNKRMTLKIWHSSVGNMLESMQAISSTKREVFLSGYFHDVFSVDLWATIEAWTPSILELVTTERRAFCLNQLELLGLGTDYTYLKVPEEAIPLLIAQVKRTPDQSKRSKILNQMIKSCVVAKDWSSLEKVCIHVASHHRNEHEDVLSNFAHEVHRYLPRCASLVAYDAILECCALMTHLDCRPSLLLSKALILSEQGLDYTETLNSFFNTPEIWNKCNLTVPEVLKPKLVSIYMEKINTVAEQEINNHLTFFIKSKFMGVSSLLEKFIENILYQSYILKLLKEHPEGKPCLKKIFLSIASNSRCLFWYWKKFPELIFENLEQVFDNLIGLHFGEKLSKINKNSLTPTIYTQLKKLCKSKWLEVNFGQKKIILLWLSYVCESREYIDVANKFIKEIESKDEADILRVLSSKYLVNTSGNLAEVCDQLTLWHVFARVPIPEFLKLWRKKQSEVISSGILVLSVVAPITVVVAEIENFKEGSWHPKTIADCYRISLKLFVDKPSIDSWQTALYFLKKSELSWVCNNLVMKNIPTDFIPLLGTALWDKINSPFSNNPLDAEEKRKQIKVKLFKSITLNMLQSFHHDLIEKMFEDAAIHSPEFFYNALVVRSSSQLIRSTQSKLSDEKFVEIFSEYVISKAVNCTVGVVEVIDVILSSPHVKPCNVALVYELEIFKIWCGTDDISNFPQNLATYWRSLDHIVLRFPLLIRSISSVIVKLSANNEDITILWLLKRLVTCCVDRIDFVICAAMLPEKVPSRGLFVNDPRIIMYDTILSSLRKIDCQIISIYLHNHLNKVICETDSSYCYYD